MYKYIIFLLLSFICYAETDSTFIIMEQAEKAYKQQKIKDGIANYNQINQKIDTTVYESKKVTSTIHNIFVDDNPTIDSLQHQFDSASAILYSNKLFKNAKKYDFNNKLLYIRFIAKNHLIDDTASIIKLCEDLYTLYDIEYYKIYRIIELQDIATKTILQPHLILAKDKLRRITNLIVLLSPQR